MTRCTFPVDFFDYYTLFIQRYEDGDSVKYGDAIVANVMCVWGSLVEYWQAQKVGQRSRNGNILAYSLCYVKQVSSEQRFVISFI